jgi:hypothetical protein
MKQLTIIILITFLPTLNSCGQNNNNKSMKIDIKKVLNNDNPTDAIIELDEYLNKVSNYGENVEKLTEEQKVVLFIENLEREINNGGFNQFFFNSSGNFSSETMDALIKIKAGKTVMIFTNALSSWPDNKVPKDMIIRRTLLEKIENKGNPIWEKCDSDFFKYEDDLTGLLLEFVKQNKDKF